MYVRTGKEEEALELCNQIKKAIPTDEATLQAVTMSLKELGKRKHSNPKMLCETWKKLTTFWECL